MTLYTEQTPNLRWCTSRSWSRRYSSNLSRCRNSSPNVVKFERRSSIDMARLSLPPVMLDALATIYRRLGVSRTTLIRRKRYCTDFELFRSSQRLSSSSMGCIYRLSRCLRFRSINEWSSSSQGSQPSGSCDALSRSGSFFNFLLIESLANG